MAPDCASLHPGYLLLAYPTYALTLIFYGFHKLNNRYSFYYRTGNIQEYVLGGCIAIALALLGVDKFSDAGTVTISMALITMAIIMVPAILWHGLIDHRPVIVLSPDGVWCRYWGKNSNTCLPWAHISEVNEIVMPKGVPIISLELKDKSYSARMLGFSGIWGNAFLGLSPFTLRVSMLDTSHEVVLALLRKYLSLSRQTSSTGP